MKLHELAGVLIANPHLQPRFIFPDGDPIPSHFHITEVGHVAKRFIDCGGKVHDGTETCVLQTHVGGDIDHRLTGAVFVKILDLGHQVLPGHDLEVEIESDCCVVSQYPIASAAANGEYIDFQLTSKRTDCLAKDRCGIEDSGGGPGSSGESAAKAASCC